MFQSQVVAQGCRSEPHMSNAWLQSSMKWHCLASCHHVWDMLGMYGIPKAYSITLWLNTEIQKVISSIVTENMETWECSVTDTPSATMSQVSEGDKDLRPEACISAAAENAQMRGVQIRGTSELGCWGMPVWFRAHQWITERDCKYNERHTCIVQ